MSSTACPRCSTPLQVGFGALGEDVCGECDGRLLSAALTRRVLVDEGGIDPALVRQLAEHYGGARLPCPLCSGRMSPITLKGTPVDVCLGCGATFLDAGELDRLSKGRYDEVSAAPMYAVVERAPEDVEPPPDARATWEKALPMYALEAAALFAVCHSRDIGGGALGALGAALGITAIPLGLSMFADVDLRGLFQRRPSFTWGHQRGGYAGAVMIVLAIAVGGVITTLNAIVSERLPKKLASWGTAAVLAGTAAVAIGLALTGR